MATRASGYFRDPFQGSRGVTQGEPPPHTPMICNIMVDTIVRNKVGLVENNKADPEGFGCTVVEKEAFFYDDYDIIASTNLVWT